MTTISARDILFYIIFIIIIYFMIFEETPACHKLGANGYQSTAPMMTIVRMTPATLRRAACTQQSTRPLRAMTTTPARTTRVYIPLVV